MLTDDNEDTGSILVKKVPVRTKRTRTQKANQDGQQDATAKISAKKGPATRTRTRKVNQDGQRDATAKISAKKAPATRIRTRKVKQDVQRDATAKISAKKAPAIRTQKADQGSSENFSS